MRGAAARFSELNDGARHAQGGWLAGRPQGGAGWALAVLLINCTRAHVHDTTPWPWPTTLIKAAPGRCGAGLRRMALRPLANARHAGEAARKNGRGAWIMRRLCAYYVQHYT